MTNKAPKTIALPLAVGMFGIGLLTVIATFALYATGHTNLPWWVEVPAVLMPIGLAVGVVSAVKQAHTR